MTFDDRPKDEGGKLGAVLLIAALVTLIAATVGLQAINMPAEGADTLEGRVGFAAGFGAAAALAGALGARLLRIVLARTPTQREADHDDRA